ncbi:hypothetical protein D9619_009546 [Psilocybe cf. subviscida]|uniref:Uncharacterized protein n=1 Tax=Psilocybe cf. subviscida TaxID=2480587 RepID=A0A8H5BLF7_9AGAR|nr:hypothetical protein D9619_009546 [Psilocybe cf. subviscida]
MQRNVLLLLSASVRQFHTPFIFLLASRSEHDIQVMFSSPNFVPLHTRLFLDDTYFPDHDIELFLRDQFEECRTIHPFSHMIPPDWPSDDIVKEITRKLQESHLGSSYMPLLSRNVKSSRHRPHHRLDVVLNLRPASRDLPFSELDALYTHIFSSVDDIERVLDVISFQITFQTWATVDDIERILRLDTGEVAILLCDLAFVIGYDDFSRNNRRLKVLHASLTAYPLDSARSKEYFIDTTKRGADHVVDCLRFLSSIDLQYQDYSIESVRTAMYCFTEDKKSFSGSRGVLIQREERIFSLPNT